MRTYTVHCELATSVSLWDAFEIFQDPQLLPQLFPPHLKLRCTTSAPVTMQRGTVLDYRFSWLGLPFSGQMVVTEYEPPFHFVLESRRGPFRRWRHRHTFRPTANGTIVEDEVEYALPAGAFGRLLHRAIVEFHIRQAFQHRQEAITALLGEIRRPAEPLITAR